MVIRCFSYSISILNKKAKFLNEKLFSFIIIYSAFWDYFASIPCWFIIYCICLLPSGILLPRFHAPCFVNAFYILHSEIMLPRFHAPCFVNAFYILHFTSWNYVASIPCSSFIYATSSISSPLFSFFI